LIADAHARAAQISYRADQIALHWLVLARADYGRQRTVRVKPSFQCRTNGRFVGMGIKNPWKTHAS
jgi:hypothetical protein